MSSTLAPSATPARQRARWYWSRGLALGLLAVLLTLTLVAAALAVWSVRRPFPQLEGEVTLPGLDAPVEVYRDELGIPSLFASTSRDLFRAQGYIHAQDRFWQMDVWRHIGAGRTAELLGPGGLESDRFLRTLGWERIAREELALMDDETRDILRAYAAGVNAYIAERSAAELSLEYSVLRLQLPSYTPPPWEPVHTLTFLKLMAWDLRSNLEEELQRGILSSTLSASQLADLYPPYPQDAPRILGAEVPADFEAGEADPNPAQAALGRVVDQLAAVEDFTGPRPDGIGSNSWVVSGAHTETGLPLLANDPHLSIEMPSTWYQVGLHCVERTPECRDEVAGFSFAGVPGVIIGHNDRIAWGFTNLAPDVMDLYVERVNPENPDQYEVDGDWADMEVEEQTLKAADGTIQTMRVRATRHGPIISDVFDPLGAYQPPQDVGAREPFVIALRWTALDPGRTIDAVPALNRARDWDQFREAASRFEVPAQNLVYADADGNIGYQAPGRIPVRASGDGRLPVPGWSGEYDWTGFVPFEELPSELNPERGWIVTANNPIAGPDYPHLLTTDWDYGYRAQRIGQLLAEAGGGLTVDGMGAIQMDARDGSADWLVPALLAVDSPDPDVRLAQDLLRDWNGQASADSAAAAVYGVTWRHVLAGTFGDQMPDSVQPGGGSRWFEVVRRLLEEPDSAWWDEAGTSGAEGRDDALSAAMRTAIAELTDRLGQDPGEWRWGDLHRATFRNGTLGESGLGVIERRFNRGPYPVSGGSSIVNATGWNASLGYEVTAVPSMRMVADLADLDRSRTIHTTGQSGHAYHEHYQDMIEHWRSGELHPMRWSREAVEDSAVNHLRLLPPRATSGHGPERAPATST
ncbi:MAG: penicillin acylase family protein [Nitriliruptorales bacterium]|nr:penicillin acylase family protein [Nitriliruptorales bacterium]